jgi:iron(III) transport system substrate-binding protein
LRRAVEVFMHRIAGLCILLVLAAWPAQAQQTTLTVYTTTASEDLARYRARFNKAHPNITINWVRDSTGTIAAKVLAEKANPQADVIHILGVTELISIDREGLLLPYKPKGYDSVDAKFKDKKNEVPHWTGLYAFEACVCFNTVEAKKKNLPRPTEWKQLADPVYQNQLVMPNPNSSGTGFMTVSAWMQTWGESATWSFLDNLHKNVATYVHSGSSPCVMAATGEFPVAISFSFRGAKEKAKGAPIDVILPSEGVGWEANGVAIMKTTKNLEAAKTFADWALSDDAFKLYGEDYAVIAKPELGTPVKFYPEKPLEKMINNDLYWASANNKRILAEWQARYGSKSAKK